MQPLRDMAETKRSIIMKAIKTKQTLSFYYKNTTEPGLEGERVRAQIVALGLSPAAKMVIRAWIDTRSVSYSGGGGWRMFATAGMSDLKLENSKWRAPKAGYNTTGDEGMKIVIAHAGTSKQDAYDFGDTQDSSKTFDQVHAIAENTRQSKAHWTREMADNNNQINDKIRAIGKKHGLPDHGLNPLSETVKHKDKWIKALGSEARYNRMLIDAYQDAGWDHSKYPTYTQAKYLNHITRKNTGWTEQDRKYHKLVDRLADDKGMVTVYRGVLGPKVKNITKPEQLGYSWTTDPYIATSWTSMSQAPGAYNKPPYKVLKAKIHKDDLISVGQGTAPYETILKPNKVNKVKLEKSWQWEKI